MSQKPKKSLTRNIIESVACIALGYFIGIVGIHAGMNILLILAFSFAAGVSFSILINTLFPVEEKKEEHESQGRDQESDKG